VAHRAGNVEGSAASGGRSCLNRKAIDGRRPTSQSFIRTILSCPE
jgi:hypothetical protein